MNRKLSREEANRAFETASLEVSRLHWAYTHKPDAEYRTGAIAGEDSRYTLRVWYRNSDTLGILVHHHPGQSDYLMAVDELGCAQFSAYAGSAHDAESHAIATLIHAARSAEYARNRIARTA